MVPISSSPQRLHFIWKRPKDWVADLTVCGEAYPTDIMVERHRSALYFARWLLFLSIPCCVLAVSLNLVLISPPLPIIHSLTLALQRHYNLEGHLAAVTCSVCQPPALIGRWSFSHHPLILSLRSPEKLASHTLQCHPKEAAERLKQVLHIACCVFHF